MSTSAMVAESSSPSSPPRHAEPRHRLPRASVLQMIGRSFVVWSLLSWFVIQALWGAITRDRGRGPRALRRAFEILGPIYVKFGQLVASGEAIFPERYSQELRALLDRVPPFSRDEVERVIAEDLGAPTGELFESFDPEPMAAASIAQVHAATIAGREVVVKVQRPGIPALAATDVAIMRLLARIASVTREGRRANLIAFVDDFANNLAEEIDFRNEARWMRKFNEVMRSMGNETVCAPAVYDALSSERVLTMERFDGWRIDDVEGVRGSPFDPEERLVQGIRSWFQSLIAGGFFHGDVHAGNFMLLRDGRIGFLDFGIVGRFEDEHKHGVMEYVLGFQQRDFGRVADAMIALRTFERGATPDREGMISDLEEAFAKVRDHDAALELKDLLPAMIRSGRRRGLRMPRELVLVTKQLIYLDRYSRAYGGEKMNVLTDQRLMQFIMQDMFAVMFSR